MRSVIQKIETFFFPCSAIVQELKRQKDEALTDFTATIHRAHCAIGKMGSCEVLTKGAANERK